MKKKPDENVIKKNYINGKRRSQWALLVDAVWNIFIAGKRNKFTQERVLGHCTDWLYSYSTAAVIHKLLFTFGGDPH